MPNGRHGAVLIPLDAVRQFLASIPGDPVVARRDRKEMHLSDVTRLAECHTDANVFVEGQTLDPYPGVAIVLHFLLKGLFRDRRQSIWVTEDRSIFEGLKQFWLTWLGRS